ncbi:hypothetical protein ACM64Y_09190 [Novispirillum sp. DQ9]|uniref:hypothetical protein n=1 Tax=Novispirillum sp. DQ9 TaxID=3398612 RepID=UPI003C7B0B16
MATYMPVRVSYETDAEVLVMQYRNVATGEVRKQVPEPAMLETYRTRAALGLPPYEPPRTATEDVAAEKRGDPVPQPAAPAPQDPAPGIGMGGFGAPGGPDSGAPMGSGVGGVASPERPVGGAVTPPFRTTA